MPVLFSSSLSSSVVLLSPRLARVSAAAASRARALWERLHVGGGQRLPAREYYLSTHFWGPLCNWGFVAAGLADMRKSPLIISPAMTTALFIYSALFMRFAWVVKPRNLLLLACHFSNDCVQFVQLCRVGAYEYRLKHGHPWGAAVPNAAPASAGAAVGGAAAEKAPAPAPAPAQA